MKWIMCFVLAAIPWFASDKPVWATASFGSGPDLSYFTCGYTTFSGRFTSKLSTYSFSGACLQTPSQVQVPWNASGTYEPATGKTTESIRLSGPSPYAGQFMNNWICGDLSGYVDPWLRNDERWDDKYPCSAQRSPQASGAVTSQAELLNALLLQSAGRPLTSRFPYDRNVLLAARERDLKAEAAAIAKATAQQRRGLEVRQATPQRPVISRISFPPSILSPTAGQRFYAQTIVPIKLWPPQNWKATAYTVSIQRKEANGSWVGVVNIPIPAAQAETAQGYLGFGGGGNGPTKSRR